jgi:protein-tyrosine-phosphatase
MREKIGSVQEMNQHQHKDLTIEVIDEPTYSNRSTKLQRHHVDTGDFIFLLDESGKMSDVKLVNTEIKSLHTNRNVTRAYVPQPLLFHLRSIVLL